jgi:type I restriction enzyme S subunit
MSEWKTYKLGEIAEITSSKRIFLADYVNEGIPFYRSKEVIERFKKNNISTELFIEKSKFEEIKTKFGVPKENDILLTSVGTIGIPFKVQKNDEFYFKDGNLTWFRNYSGQIIPDYLYYWIQSGVGKDAIDKTKIGSTQQALTIASLKQIEITVPDLATQTQIAQILTSLDDKIELNLQMNQTLEAMAQALFKEWFVDFNFPTSSESGFAGLEDEQDLNKKSSKSINPENQGSDNLPKGWRMGKLGEMVTIKRGGSPRPIQNFMADTGLRWLKISDVTGLNTPFVLGTKEFIKEEGLTKTTLLKKGALILSNSATPGIPKILNVDCCIHDGWLHFPTSKFSNEFLYLQFLKLRGELVQQANGSIFTNLKTDIVREFQVPIATDDVFENFDSIVKPIFNKLLNNTLEIQTLTQTRDTLLPKLMSGKIRLNQDLQDSKIFRIKNNN